MPSKKFGRLAAIVAADMVGYCRLNELDEVEIVSRQKKIWNERISPKVSEFGGRIVKTTGDGALIELSSSALLMLSRGGASTPSAKPRQGCLLSDKERIAGRAD